MTTYRIIEASGDVAGLKRYWVFATIGDKIKCLASHARSRRALGEIFDRVQDDDIVQSLAGKALHREEFGVDFKARLAQYFEPGRAG